MGDLVADIAVFPVMKRTFDHYLGDTATPERGIARIARLVGSELSNSIGAGVVIYERMSIDWSLAFDEAIVVLDGTMLVHSGDKTYECAEGDVEVVTG